MKKIASMALCFVSIILLSTSCTKEEDKDFDQQLLLGKWQEGTLYERYDVGGTGATWDTADDVKESEAQPFTWTLKKDQLGQVHLMQNGTKVPKTYTVTELSATTLSYKDDFGKSYTFKKVN
ncbi:hypothetical protein E0494_03325 [Marinilabiliaceae bacterium JC040]|nr:hypothetical protein [Marinilabiliaceae bacterium JC040]